MHYHCKKAYNYLLIVILYSVGVYKSNLDHIYIYMCLYFKHICANTHMHWCTFVPSLHWPEISADLKNCCKIPKIQQAASRNLVHDLLAHIYIATVLYFKLWLVWAAKLLKSVFLKILNITVWLVFKNSYYFSSSLDSYIS